MTRNDTGRLPSLDETLDRLAQIEKRYPDDLRVAATRKAIDANARFATDRARIDTYLGHLGAKDMFVPIYGIGNFPNGLPVALPFYIVDIMEASARVLCALMRKGLRESGPQCLLERAPEGYLSAEMAEKLHDYYLGYEPDMSLDVLVFGRNSHRGMSFDEFKRTGDMLDARILESQSVDTYYGWIREYIRGARSAGLGDGHTFTCAVDEGGRLLSDEALDRQVLATFVHPFPAEPESILFFEIEPKKQATFQNLEFMAAAMSGGDPKKVPAILDASSLLIRDGRLYVNLPGDHREIKKVISRVVDSDLQGYVKARAAANEMEIVERMKQMYRLPHLWTDLSKHLMGFYLIDKSSLTDMSMLGSVNIAPKTELATSQHVERYRRNPEGLKEVAIKPLHGMSAKGVVVGPTVEELEQAVAEQPMLIQECIWATPILPNVNPEIDDDDVQAGICSEARLVLQAGTPAVPHEPHRSRLIAVISRNHYQSRSPERRIKNDPRGRGWYSNMGAILAVKGELGITTKNDAGLGMGPVYWLD